jgi:hypothetical protein
MARCRREERLEQVSLPSVNRTVESVLNLCGDTDTVSRMKWLDNLNVDVEVLINTLQSPDC